MYGLYFSPSLLLLHFLIWIHPCHGNHCQLLQSLENKGVVVDGTDKDHLIIDGSTENSLECFELCCDTDDCVVAEFYSSLQTGQINNCFLFACNPLDSCKFEDQKDTLVQVFDKSNQTKHSPSSSTNHVTSTPENVQQVPSVLPPSTVQTTTGQEGNIESNELASTTIQNNLFTNQKEPSSKITTTSEKVTVSSAPSSSSLKSTKGSVSTDKSPSTPKESNNLVKNVPTTKAITTTTKAPVPSSVQTTHASQNSTKNITESKTMTSSTLSNANTESSTKTTLSSVTHASASPSTTTVSTPSAISADDNKLTSNTTVSAQNKSESLSSTTNFQSPNSSVTNVTTTAKISTTKSESHEQTTELPENKTNTGTTEGYTTAVVNASETTTSSEPSSSHSFKSSSKHTSFSTSKLTTSSNTNLSSTTHPSSISQSSPSLPTITPTLSQSNQSLQNINEENYTTTINEFSDTDIQNITGYNQTSDESYLAEEHSSHVLSVALIGALSFGIIFFIAVLALVFKRCFDSWQRRHYSRIDYLVNGMYN